MKVTQVPFLLLIAAICSVAAAQLRTLPQPFATPSANNSARVIPKPDATQLQVPAGFSVSIYADNLQAPRTMIYSPNGDLFVAQSRAGSVVIMRDTNNDGEPDARYVYAQGLAGVFGMAFHDGYLYLGRTDSIVRYKYKDGDTQAQGMPEKLVDLPTGGHSTRNIVFSRDGRKMYVAVGSASNKNDGEEPRRAAINEYNPDGTGHRVLASGIRNPVGLTLQPGTAYCFRRTRQRSGSRSTRAHNFRSGIEMALSSDYTDHGIGRSSRDTASPSSRSKMASRPVLSKTS